MRIYTSKNLKTFLGKSDIVVTILPNTNETKDFIDYSQYGPKSRIKDI